MLLQIEDIVQKRLVHKLTRKESQVIFNPHDPYMELGPYLRK